MAAIKSYLWYVADGDISMQSIALMASKVPQIKEPKVTAKSFRRQTSMYCLLLLPIPRLGFGAGQS